MIAFGIPIDCIILDRDMVRSQSDDPRIEHHHTGHHLGIHTGVCPLHAWEIWSDSVDEDLTSPTALCLPGVGERGGCGGVALQLANDVAAALRESDPDERAPYGYEIARMWLVEYGLDVMGFPGKPLAGLTAKREAPRCNE
jgi:hypothetical protein